MTVLDVELPPKLIPVFSGPADYRGAYGGRGSAKTRSFAKVFAVEGLRLASAGNHGQILAGREYMNSLAESSFAEIAAAIEETPALASNYEVGEKFIRTGSHLPGRIDVTFAGMQNVNSLKSRAKIYRAWIDEAEHVQESAWEKFIPTIREEGAELWVTWNPEIKGSATDRRFRQQPPERSEIVEINWRDNPWFPETLNRKRLADLRDRPDRYGHIWEGEYVTAATGAYYASGLREARDAGRICGLAADPLLPVVTFHDIGGAGAKADAYVIWVCQFVGVQVRVLDFYQSQGQVLAHHIGWLRDNGYEAAEIVLPHDGANTNNLSGKRYEDHWREAGFRVRSIPNQGAGAAKMRIEAVRRLFPQIWFDEKKTEDGRIELGLYAPRVSTTTGADMGPNHDFSHAADAFGLMAICYEPPAIKAASAGKIEKLLGVRRGGASGWMGN